MEIRFIHPARTYFASWNEGSKQLYIYQDDDVVDTVTLLSGTPSYSSAYETFADYVADDQYNSAIAAYYGE